MVSNRKIKIKKQFDLHGREIVNYLRQNSEQNANKFINKVKKKLIK